MYWFKRVCFVFSVFFLSCTGQKENREITLAPYFDIAGFFESEEVRLNQQRPQILKTIVKNGQTESKTLQIMDWERELGLFGGSDINKPAWTKSYEVSQSGDTLSYSAVDPDLRTRLIRVVKTTEESVRMVYVRNMETNTLYTSTEELFYYPDSLYLIHKNQDVKVIGNNKYTIQGSFLD